MKTLLALTIATLLAGCAGFDTLQTTVAQRGAQAADEARETAEWTLCNGISVGAWRRAYAGDPVKGEGWKRLCAQAEAAPQ